MAERKPVDGAALEDLDPDLLERFMESIRQRDPEGRGRFTDQRELLRRSGVLHPGGSPTMAGVLALGLYPQQWFPRLVISAAAEPLRGEPPAARARNQAIIDGPIPQMLDKAMDWARQTFDTYIVNAPDGSVHDQYAYPLDAFRELIANALIHRDLDQWSAGLAIEVRLRRDRLVIANPGGLYGITVDRLGKDTVTSARNDRLAAICQHVYSAATGARAIEALATGIPIVTRAVADAGLPPARYSDTGIRFTVVLYQRAPEPAHRRAQELAAQQAPEPAAPSTVNSPVLTALGAGPRSVAQLAEATGTPSYTIRRILRSLRESGRVTQHGGKGRRTTYSLTPESSSRTAADRQFTEISPVPNLGPSGEDDDGAPSQEQHRRPNSVTILIDSDAINEGTPLTFRPQGSVERQKVGPWLAEDSRRATATWVAHRSKPLLWAADQETYSPSGLITKIWDLSGWPEPPVAVQGPRQWYLPDGRSLLQAAQDILDEDGE